MEELQVAFEHSGSWQWNMLSWLVWWGQSDRSMLGSFDTLSLARTSGFVPYRVLYCRTLKLLIRFAEIVAWSELTRQSFGFFAIGKGTMTKFCFCPRKMAYGVSFLGQIHQAVGELGLLDFVFINIFQNQNLIKTIPIMTISIRAISNGRC